MIQHFDNKYDSLSLSLSLSGMVVMPGEGGEDVAIALEQEGDVLDVSETLSLSSSPLPLFPCAF